MSAPGGDSPDAEATALRARVEELQARLAALARVLPLDTLDLLRMSTGELDALSRRPDVFEAGEEAPCPRETTARAELEHLWALLAPPGEP